MITGLENHFLVFLRAAVYTGFTVYSTLYTSWVVKVGLKLDHFNDQLQQGSYRQVCVKFKDFYRTYLPYSDSPIVFKDYKFMKNPNLHIRFLLLDLD